MMSRERLLFHYTRALERGDFDTVAAVLRLAADDPLLEAQLLEINEALAQEVMLLPGAHSAAALSSNGHHPDTTKELTMQTATVLVLPARPRPARRIFPATLVAAALSALLFTLALLLPGGGAPIPNDRVTLDDLRPITADNAAGLMNVQTIGRGQIQDAYWSPDGAQFALATPLGTYVHDAATFDTLNTLPDLFPLGYDADGTLLMMTMTREIRRVNPLTGEVLAEITLDDARNTVYDVKRAGDALLLVTVSCQDGSAFPCATTVIKLWRVTGNAADMAWELSFDGEVMLFPRLSDDGRWLALAFRQGVASPPTALMLYDAAAGTRVWTQNVPYLADYAFSADGWLFAYSDGDTRVDLVSLVNGVNGIGTIFSGPVLRLAFSQGVNKTLLVGGQRSGQLLFWDAAQVSPDDGRVSPLARVSLPRGGWGWYSALAFNPDGALLLVDARSRVYTYDVRTAFAGDTAGPLVPRTLEALYDTFYADLTFSPDSRWLATTGERYGIFADDGAPNVRLWSVSQVVDADDPGALPRFPQADGTYNSAAFAPNSARLALVQTGTLDTSDGLIYTLADASSIPLTLTTGSVHSAIAATFVADGTLLTIHEGGLLVRWNGVTGEQVGSLRLFETVRSNTVLGFSANGALLAVEHCREEITLPLPADASTSFVECGDTVVELYSTATGDVVAALDAGYVGFHSVALAFSPDGTRAAVLGCRVLPEGAQIRPCASRRLTVWNLAAVDAGGTPVLLWGQDDVASSVSGMAFSPRAADGAMLLVTVSWVDGVTVLAADDGTALASFPALKQAHSAAFSPDGRVLALAGPGVVWLWGTTTP